MSDTEARAADDAGPDDEGSGEPGAHAAPAPAAASQPSPAAEAPPDEQAPEDGGQQADEQGGEQRDDAPEPSWWHRSHPTFAGLVGFFTGVAYVIVVPGVYAGLLGLLVGANTAQKLFPLVLVALVVPLVMLAFRKTRRFAEFMFLGIISTVVVVALTATLVIWVMVKTGQ